MDSTNEFQLHPASHEMDVHVVAPPAFNLAYPDSFLMPDAQTMALGLLSTPGSFDPMSLMVDNTFPHQDGMQDPTFAKIQMDPTTYAAWLAVASERIEDVSPFEAVKHIQFDTHNLALSPLGMKYESGDVPSDTFACDMEQYICLNPVNVQSLATTTGGTEHLFTSSAFSPLSPMTMVTGSVSPGNGTLSPPPLMSSPPLFQTAMTSPVWARMNAPLASTQILHPAMTTMAPLLPHEQTMLSSIKFDIPSPVTDFTPFSIASRLSPPAADQHAEPNLPFAVRNSASPAPSLRPQSESPMPDSAAPTPTPPSSTSSTPLPPNPLSSAAAAKAKAMRLATYNKWSQEEDLLLRHAVSIHGTVGKWSLVAAMVPGRTPIQCSTRWLGALNPTIHKGKWAAAEDATLLSAYAELTTDPEHPPWNKIAERIPGRTPVQCIARYQEALDPTVKKGKWCAEEDRLLRAGLEEYGKCWVKIASRIPGRTQRQCRTRWLQLRPKVDEVSRSESESVVGSSVGGTPEPGSSGDAPEVHSGGPKRNVRRTAVPNGVGSTVAAASGGAPSKGRKRRESKAMEMEA